MDYTLLMFSCRIALTHEVFHKGYISNIQPAVGYVKENTKTITPTNSGTAYIIVLQKYFT